MLFEENLSKLYSDTLLPDVFISEYLPGLDGDSVKLYIYLLYLKKYGKKATENELSILLGIELQKIKQSFEILEEKGAIEKKERHVFLKDLKDMEIGKLFRMKTTSQPEEAVRHAAVDKKRSDIINSINNRFFQGLMPMSWFTDIDMWFDMFKFDEEVMFSLFQNCYDYKALNKNYIQKVASEWHAKGIKNFNQLEKYMSEYEKFKDIRSKIVKKLKLGRNLTEYEERYVSKWVIDYKYDFDVIETALMKTTGKNSPNINYIDGIITSWHKKGLTTNESVIKDIEEFKKQRIHGANRIDTQGSIPQKDNFEMRDLDDEYFENLYKNPRIKE